jgi:Cu/Zn superoxide dismutase
VPGHRRRCDPPDFATAGGIFNPSGKQHGLRNPDGPMAGDLPNLVVGRLDCPITTPPRPG